MSSSCYAQFSMSNGRVKKELTTMPLVVGRQNNYYTILTKYTNTKNVILLCFKRKMYKIPCVKIKSLLLKFEGRTNKINYMLKFLNIFLSS